MFPKINKTFPMSYALTLILSSQFFSSPVMAQRLNILQIGDYRLVTGAKELCGQLSISAQDTENKFLHIGAHYTFETLNSTHNVESDIDPNCQFHEQNIRNEQNSGELNLTHVNEEICNEQSISKTVSVVKIQAGEIHLTHEISGAISYSCFWKLQKPTP